MWVRELLPGMLLMQSDLGRRITAGEFVRVL